MQRYDFSAIHDAFDRESEADLRFACLELAAGLAGSYGSTDAESVVKQARTFFEFVNGAKDAGDH